MIVDYAELRAAVQNYLARDDLIDFIPYFVELAQRKLNRSFRIRAMEVVFDETIAAGVIALPTDFLEARHLYVDASPIRPLEFVNLETLYTRFPDRSANRVPRICTREVNNLIFGPPPDSDYTVKGTYFAEPALLDANTDTHWGLTKGVMLYACLLEAEPFLQNDPRLEIWAAMYRGAAEEVMKEDKRERMAGSAKRQMRG